MAEQITVRRSTVLDAPIEAVWHLLRDFNSHAQWHPAVAESTIEGGKLPDQVGCVRRFRLQDGGLLREQLLALDDAERRFVYCLLEAPIPLQGYVAEVRLKPVTATGGTFWEWRSSFHTPPGRERELAELVAREIYQAGFAAVGVRLDRRGEQVAPAPPAGPAPAPAARRPLVAVDPVSECQAVVLERHGGPEALAWRQVEVPPPGPGQVRLRHTAIGVNYIDVYCRTGYFPLIDPPGGIGMEAAGVVTDVGPGVEHLVPGQRVAYAAPPPGAYAEARTLDADLVVPLPDEVDDETAAAGLLKGMTAAFLLHEVHPVRAGETVLVYAAAGGVGQLLCQWARQLGATVIGIAGGEDKTRIARRNGCHQVADSHHEDVAERVLAWTAGRGADVAYDAVGQASLEHSCRALAQRGHLVSFGQASGPIESLDPAALSAKSLTVSRPNYSHYVGTRADVERWSSMLFEALAQGQLRVHVGQRLPLRDAAEAHRRLESRQTVGASILLP